jgi:tripartite-type tricarboxylate transporter receptor subunit TctC
MGPTRVQYIREGRVHLLAFIGKDKALGFQDVPSFPELYGIEATSHIGVWGPRGLPDYVLERLEDAFAKAVKDPNFINAMNRAYAPLVYMNRAEVNKDIRELTPKYAEILKKIKAEEAKEKK